jgi:tRNA A-37 threonylcarbamoyl transferase component Bud32
MNTIKKIVSSREFYMYNISSNYNISPKLLNYKKIYRQDLYEITMEKYDMDLHTYFLQKKNINTNLIKKIDKLIDIMHIKYKIIHGDLHFKNIVLKKNKKNIDIKIIDFSESFLLYEVNDEIISLFNDWNSTYCNNIKDIIKWEKKYYKIDLK